MVSFHKGSFLSDRMKIDAHERDAVPSSQYYQSPINSHDDARVVVLEDMKAHIRFGCRLEKKRCFFDDALTVPDK